MLVSLIQSQGSNY